MGFGGDPGGRNATLRVLSHAVRPRFSGRHTTRVALWHHGLRIHDFRGAARRAKESAGLARGSRTDMDARAPVARIAGATADSFPWRLSLWRRAHERAAGASHRYRCKRFVWRR